MTHQPTLYALLVGIDAYESPVPPLRGCRNDIEAFAQLLEARAAGPVRIRTLLDGQATREAVVAGFREHLAQAGPGDAALLYYSGHGSQEPAPEKWWHLEPDRLDETLVLFDSRSPGQWDLADKELAALLGEVAAREPHLAVVLDCCHSGSGTRAALEDGTAGRRAPADHRERPLGSFVFDPDAVDALARTPGAAREAGDESGWALPAARHVLLSGCRANETSKEVVHGEKHRGAMSAALEAALVAAGPGALTYREVHRQLASTVRTLVRAQTPQLEASDGADLDRPFLGATVEALPPHFVATHGDTGWTVDGGTMHGLLSPVRDERTLLDIMAQDGAPAASAEVADAGPATATITVTSGALDPGRVYRAVVTSTPLPPLLVALEGTEEDAAALRSSLEDRDAAGPRLVAEAGAGEPAEATVTCTPGHYAIRRAGSERELTPSASTPEEALGVLEHVAAWLRTLRLQNPGSRIADGGIAVGLDAEAGEGERDIPASGPIRLGYVRESDGTHRARRYTVKATNTSQQPLWVGLLDLTDTFGVYADAVPAGSEQLAPGQSTEIALLTDVPDALWERGVTEVTDVLKLVVGTEEFDLRGLQQGDLDVSAPPRDAAVRSTATGLDAVLGRAATRRAKPQGAGAAAADWYAHSLEVVSVRPRDGVAVSPDRSAELAPGVGIAPHPALRARAQLAPALSATRDLDAPPVPDALQGEGSSSFALSATRAGEAEADALVLTLEEGGDPGSVTPEQPLIVRLDRPLAPGEHVLPFAWDGEFYLPLGFARPAPADGGGAGRAGGGGAAGRGPADVREAG
ncbi:caspase family protein, partial [Sinomonas halotolerans]